MKLWPMKTAEPTTKPGFAGLKYRDILQVLDYEAVRTPAHLHWFTNGRRSFMPHWAYWVPFLAWIDGPSPSCRTSFHTLQRVHCYSPGDSHSVTFLSPIWRLLGLWKGHLIIPKGSPADLPGPFVFSSTVVLKSCGIFRWNVFRIRIGLHSSIVDQESGHEARLFGLVGTLGHHLSRKQKIHCGCLGFRGWQSIQL